jgi:serine/threonine protein kinase
MIGRAISHYRIIEQLGAGGMGEVYLASDTTLGRRVALKLLKPEHTQDPERVRRFRHEAKSASALNHPNILTIYEVGEADGHHFIATEFIDGENLRAALGPSGRMETGEVLKVVTQVAAALAAAHEAGIVHRDIKPENIMLRRDGYAKVLDFGLAKLTEAAAAQSAVAGASLPVQTASGLILGTTDYMSPEQATGGKIDARSDIFSFGTLLYEMLSGRPAFRSDSTMRTVAAILTKEPEPLPTTTDSELTKIVLRCLRKDPERRYQSIADVKVALEDVLETQSGKQVPTAARRRWGWAAVVPLVIIAGYFVRQGLRAPGTSEQLQAVPLTTLRGMLRYPSFSPNGDRVAFSWTGPNAENPDVYVQQIGSGTPLRLTQDPGNDFNPVWSPDGRWIAFLRSQSEAGRSEVRLIPPLGGSERKLAEIHVRGGTLLTPPYLTWCPDNTCLIATDSPGESKPDALFAISLDAGDKRQLTHPVTPALGDISPAVSPNGDLLVFRRMAGLFVGELHALTLGTGTTAQGATRRLTSATMNAEYPAFMPNGKEILFASRSSLWRMRVDGEGTAARLPFVGEYGLMPVLSREQPGRPSQLVYVRSFDDGNIWRLETPKAGAQPVSAPAVAITSTRLEDMPQLSPDGRRVTFTSDRSGNWEIWVADPNGENAVALTSMGAVAAGYPHWSPNGDEIVFHSNLESQWDVYAVSASGGKPRRLTEHPAGDDFPSYSRDGKWIYFSSNRTTPQDQTIWKVPVAGGDAIPVTTSSAYAAQESPDGAYLYYVETIDRPSVLWRRPVSGERAAAEKVLEGVHLANFAVLTTGIYYISRPSGQGGIHYVDLPVGETVLQYFDFATKKSTIVARNLGKVDLPLTVSADGRTILYPRVDSSVNDLMLVANFR